MRSDDALQSHPSEPYSYPINRLLDKLLTEEGVRQFVGPILLPSYSETDTAATFSLVVIDIAKTVDPSNPVQFEQDGTLFNPTTGPVHGPSGTYTYTFNKDPKHVISVAFVVHQKDLTDIRSVAQAFDWDSAANVLNLTYSLTGNTAKVTATFDTDTKIGANSAQWSSDGGSTWNNFTVASDLTGSFTIAVGTSGQTVWVRGLNHVSSPGPFVAIDIAPFGISLIVTAAVSDTEVVITVFGVNLQYAIDGGTFGSLPADADLAQNGIQIDVFRDTATHVYTFTSTVGGQSSSHSIQIPKLGDDSGGTYTALDNQLFDDVTNTVEFSWTWTGATAAFNIYVSEAGAPYQLFTTTASGVSSYVYTTSFDLTTSHADPTVDIGFFVEAVNGFTLGARCINTVGSYHHV